MYRIVIITNVFFVFFFTYQNKDDPSSPSWRYVQTGGHDKIKWWKKNFHREATITIAPNPAVAAPAAAPIGMNATSFFRVEGKEVTHFLFQP